MDQARKHRLAQYSVRLIRESYPVATQNGSTTDNRLADRPTDKKRLPATGPSTLLRRITGIRSRHFMAPGFSTVLSALFVRQLLQWNCLRLGPATPVGSQLTSIRIVIFGLLSIDGRADHAFLRNRRRRR